MARPKQQTSMIDSSTLPSPLDRPSADIVIFDGECSFCRRQVRRLHRWDWHHRLAFVSLHDPLVAQRWPQLDHAQLMQQMYVVDPQGSMYGGASALRYLSRRLPPLWPIAALLHIPGTLPLWRVLYGWVARRRYVFGKSPCADGACAVGSQPADRRQP